MRAPTPVKKSRVVEHRPPPPPPRPTVQDHIRRSGDLALGLMLMLGVAAVILMFVNTRRAPEVNSEKLKHELQAMVNQAVANAQVAKSVTPDDLKATLEQHPKVLTDAIEDHLKNGGTADDPIVHAWTALITRLVTDDTNPKLQGLLKNAIGAELTRGVEQQTAMKPALAEAMERAIAASLKKGPLRDMAEDQLRSQVSAAITKNLEQLTKTPEFNQALTDRLQRPDILEAVKKMAKDQNKEELKKTLAPGSKSDKTYPTSQPLQQPQGPNEATKGSTPATGEQKGGRMPDTAGNPSPYSATPKVKTRAYNVPIPKS